MFLNNLKNRLKRDAVPTLFNVRNPPPQAAPKRKPPIIRSVDSLVKPSKHQKLDKCASEDQLRDNTRTVGFTGLKINECSTTSSDEESTRNAVKDHQEIPQSAEPCDESPKKRRLRQLAWKWKTRASCMTKHKVSQATSLKTNGSIASNLPNSVLEFKQMFKPGKCKYSKEVKKFALSAYFF